MKPQRKRPGRPSTPAGEHVPILLYAVAELLVPRPGLVVVDATLGWAGHACELLRRTGPAGKLIGLDLDRDNLPRAEERLRAIGHPFCVRQSNFAALDRVLGEAGVSAADSIFADLGMSSMQVDDPERGFSYRRDGPLDMRMDRGRGQTAADLLASISEVDLAAALRELGDEPEAERVARVIIRRRTVKPFEHTLDLAQTVLAELFPRARQPVQPARWNNKPLARLFQTLRMLVNRERGNLEHFLRILPACLNAGGRAAVLTFHSGEDRLVKGAFREGKRGGVYAAIAEEPVQPAEAECQANPRARSAKLRWALRA
jgi:16S rRNA (cytosine1402-N4)-methyltransferase